MAFTDFIIILILFGILYIMGCFHVVVTTRMVTEGGQPLKLTRRNIRLSKGPVDFSMASFIQKQKLDSNSDATEEKDRDILTRN